MRLSELQRKDIINLNTGKRVGRIIDIELDSSNGQMINMIVETHKVFKNVFNNEREINVKFEQIQKLGEDVILIDIS